MFGMTSRLRIGVAVCAYPSGTWATMGQLGSTETLGQLIAPALAAVGWDLL